MICSLVRPDVEITDHASIPGDPHPLTKDEAEDRFEMRERSFCATRCDSIANDVTMSSQEALLYV